MSAEPVRKLYITLRRSFAGTRETQRKTLESLGFRYRQQTIILANDASVRGAVDKVKHLVTVETDAAFAARKAAEAAARAPREPVRVLHQRAATETAPDGARV